MNFRKSSLIGPTVSTVLAVLLASTSPSFAQSAEEKGLEIVTAADQRDSGWKHLTSEMEMILRNRTGKESRRKMTSRQLEVEGDGDKSLSLFKEPRDVAGTAMLTFSYGLDADDQWLYLPAIKRVKRISSKNKSGPFMGSEFAFEDIGSPEIENFPTDSWTRKPVGKAINAMSLNASRNMKTPGIPDRWRGLTKNTIEISRLNITTGKIP